MSRPHIDRDRVFDADRIPFTRDWAICRYCGRPVHRYENWHVAHEIARANWPRCLAWMGRDSLWNVGVAHARCNLAAGRRNMTIWQSLSLRAKIKLIAVLFTLFFLIFLIVSL